jgi:hypothetical protein
VPVGTSTERFIRLGDTAQLSSNIVGLSVYNNKDKIGDIKDIAMDNSGVRAYILSVGGFLGMGAHYVAESWLGLSEQLFRFDKWNLCLGDESDGPAKRDRLIPFFT